MINRLYHRLMMLIGRGKVITGDDAGATQLLQVKFSSIEVRDNTPRLAEYGLVSMPPGDSDALVVFVGGDRSAGVVVATGNQSARMRNLAVGEVAIHDDQGQSVYITRTGIVINGGGLPVKIMNTSQVTLDTPQVVMTGNLHVNGNIVADGDISDHTTKTMAGMRTAYNGHTHPDPQGGSTGTPSAGM
jgi:phage baseplate assembly protein V